MNPRVSVIIPVRNGERTLARAIDSALSQTYTGGVEIIVVNNGSTDGTARIIASYGDRIVAIAEPTRGVSRARNAGIAAARGEYLALLDADDWWMPEKLERVLPLLEHDPNCVLAYHDAVEVDAAGKLTRSSYRSIGRTKAASLKDLLSGRTWGLQILTCNVVMRRDAVVRVGGFNEALPACEDTALWIGLRELGRFDVLSETLSRREWEPVENRENAYILGGQGLSDLLRPRYGDCIAALAASWSLNLAGTMAMRRGDRALARKRYVASLRLRPDRIRVWLRLCSTLLPVRFVESIERMRRGRQADDNLAGELANDSRLGRRTA
jgi:glycosyltransferase involved in cell wall biosynthesis